MDNAGREYAVGKCRFQRSQSKLTAFARLRRFKAFPGEQFPAKLVYNFLFSRFHIRSVLGL
jgi:hypothetical protein